MDPSGPLSADKNCFEEQHEKKITLFQYKSTLFATKVEKRPLKILQRPPGPSVVEAALNGLNPTAGRQEILLTNKASGKSSMYQMQLKSFWQKKHETDHLNYRAEPPGFRNLNGC